MNNRRRGISVIFFVAFCIAVLAMVIYYAIYKQGGSAAKPDHPIVLDHARGQTSATTLPAPNSQEMPDIEFYGLTVDDKGSPVVGADVTVSIWKVPPGWSSRTGPPLRDVTEHVSVQTERCGKFVLAGRKGYMLQVLDIRKPGHVWLVDWDWSSPVPKGEHSNDNRYFIYAGGFPIYIPDEERPAVFPLHREGSADTGSPSRGGSDKLSDGRVVANQPVKPLVPSTGPGAPKTAIERIDRVRQLHSTTQPKGGE